MIKLFITDIDGCLTTPFEIPDWDLLSEIRRLNQQSVHDMAVPPLSICSGRPMSYVEAVAQWLGIDKPAVFESAGVYTLSTNEIYFSSDFDEEAEQQVIELKQWMRDEIVPNYNNLIPEFTKRMDAGIVHMDKAVIDEIHPTIIEYVNKKYPDFEVHKTDVSINVILSGNNKKNGIQKVCELLDIQPEEVAYIGDSSGDIPGLKIVGKAYAPENASDGVKQEAEVLEQTATEAVLEAYRRVIQQNRKILAEAG